MRVSVYRGTSHKRRFATGKERMKGVKQLAKHLDAAADKQLEHRQIWGRKNGHAGKVAALENDSACNMALDAHYLDSRNSMTRLRLQHVF